MVFDAFETQCPSHLAKRACGKRDRRKETEIKKGSDLAMFMTSFSHDVFPSTNTRNLTQAGLS